MRNKLKYRSSSIITLAIVSCTLFFCTCISNNDKKPVTESAKRSSEYNLYAGSEACAACHKSIYENHILTAHFHTSELATTQSIKGSLDSGKNKYTYSNGGVVAMEKGTDGIYQLVYVNGIEKKRQRFDIVTGSATKGQTYLTWSGPNLFQLPVSYFTSALQWCNSPGHPNKIALNRPITSRCLECHATYAENIVSPYKETEAFDKNHMILGVDCEKCHGPGAKHVAFQQQNPTTTKGEFITNPARFTRQQSLDLCAICHGGRLRPLKPAFEFKAGDNLGDFFVRDTTSKDTRTIDVHGNQYGLLAASKCFKQTSTLTCMTCHNPHEKEQGNVELFSQRCITCHNGTQGHSVFCKLNETIGKEINKNCVNCHMPQLPSRAIAVLLQGSDTLTPASMHTHLIKNYPEETQKVLAYLKTKTGR